MQITLFIPCLVNHLYPEIARDSLELLEKLGHEVSYPPGQTCCGQIMSNSGCMNEARACVAALGKALSSSACDAIVTPAASCALAARENLKNLTTGVGGRQLAGKLFELTEFLHDISPIERPLKPLHQTVSLQMSCHGLRQLDLGTPSELVTAAPHNKLATLLALIPELGIRQPERDECCGFGGTFSIDEPEVSGKMSRDKLSAHLATGADTIVGYDPSCLMSLSGVVSRSGAPIQVMHVSTLLNRALQEV